MPFGDPDWVLLPTVDSLAAGGIRTALQSPGPDAKGRSRSRVNDHDGVEGAGEDVPSNSPTAVLPALRGKLLPGAVSF